MRFNFRKVSALLTSAVMIGSSAGLAAAANYPSPFVSGGNADVAIVYGSGAGVSPLDAVQAGKVSTDLQARMGGTGTSSTTTSITGDAVELFGGTKLYVNDTLSAVKSAISSTDLKTVLGDQTFSGNVDAKTTFTLQLGSNPILTYAKHPTSTYDPQFGYQLGTTGTTQYVYNATVSFAKAVNFTHADSKGQEIILFGQRFTVASSTDNTNLVLLKTAQKIFLSSDANPSQEVTIGTKKYTVELVAATDTSATIKVTNEAGASEQKEVNEGASKKVNSLTIAVNNADESTALNKVTAEVVAGAEKVTFKDSGAIQLGEDNNNIDGTNVNFTGSTNALTGMRIQVAAKNSDVDSIVPGQAFLDPVFGTFKIDFSGFNIPENSSDRENVAIKNSGDDKMTVTFTDHKSGVEKTIQYLKNNTNQKDLAMQRDNDGHNITVIEAAVFHRGDYVVVGNENKGYLLELSSVTNDSSSTAGLNDKLTFKNVFTGTSYETQATTSEGSASVTIEGDSYTVTYAGASSPADSIDVSLEYPDSTGNDRIIYPTIQTSKGGKLFFYRPQEVNLTREAVRNGLNSTNLRFPDGDGYTNVLLQHNLTQSAWNVTVGSTTTVITTGGNAAVGANSTAVAIGRLTYNITSGINISRQFGGAAPTSTASEANLTTVYLTSVSGGNIVDPAIVIFEEKDDNSNYEALIAITEAGGNSDDGVGVSDVERTWDADNTGWEVSLASDSKKTKEGDLWGSIILLDSGDSDQKTSTINYPNDQIYAKIYAAANAAEISTSGSSAGGSTQLGNVIVTDSEIDSVKGKNLVIIGGSCINSAAATLLGGALCGAAFTEKTGVGTGQYLIKGYSGGFTTGKVALLVAGYDKEDTANAATYLTKQTVDTMSSYKGTTATTAELQTTTA